MTHSHFRSYFANFTFSIFLSFSSTTLDFFLPSSFFASFFFFFLFVDEFVLVCPLPPPPPPPFSVYQMKLFSCWWKAAR